MMSDCQDQRKGKTEYLADLFQVAVDVVDGCIMLPPLFLRVFGCYDREEIGCVGSVIFIYNFLQVMGPDDDFFPTCCLGGVNQAVPFDVVLGEIKQIAAGHSICEDGEKKEVTGEDDGGVKVAYVHVP